MRLPVLLPARSERVLARPLVLETPATNINMSMTMIPHNPLAGSTSTVQILMIATTTGIQQILLRHQAHPSSH